MKLLRRTLSVLSSTMLIASLILVAPQVASAHSTSQLDFNFNGYCSSGGVTPNTYGYNIVRTSTQVGSKIDGSGGRIVARALWPCVHGNGTYTSKSLILAADLQSNAAADGAYNFVQAGIGKVHLSDGTTQCSGSNAMVNDQTHFIWTPSALSNGVFCRAYWVDFNNDGTADNPVNGQSYDFTITEYIVGPVKYWRFCITDVSAAATDCINIARSTNNGGVSGSNASWWGCESGNFANALGMPNNTAPATLLQMRYRKAGTTPWLYTENSAVAQPWGPTLSWMDYIQDQAGTGEQLDCMTAVH